MNIRACASQGKAVAMTEDARKVEQLTIERWELRQRSERAGAHVGRS